KYIYVDDSLGKNNLITTVLTKEVKGIVVREDGKPLEGAAIVVKGKTIGCTSDSKGYFRLEGISDEDLLVVSYIGFTSKVIKPDFKSEMTIQMIRQTIVTEPVNIPPPPPPPPPSSIEGGNMIPPPPPPPPPPPADFKIKGNGPPPLIVVDGMITDIDVNKIDPETIYSINVLKDKSSIDKYGEKGEDGVIEITTKKTSILTKSKMSDVNVTGVAKVQKTDDNKVVLVEEMPMFPGGEKAMLAWISDNLKYPGEAIRNKIAGLVYVNFVVSSSGKLKNVLIKNSVNPLLDAEAIRVIKNMPDWNPGKQNGKAVDVDYTVPVSFKLQ
ncbi:MAG: TonB family protein, partial [Bacteroidetes bacterium]